MKKYKFHPCHNKMWNEDRRKLRVVNIVEEIEENQKDRRSM
jgi:hypothetical protein